MHKTRVAAVMAALLISVETDAMANGLSTEDQAIVVFLEDAKEPLARDEVQSIVRETVATHLRDQEIHRLDPESLSLVKFGEVYPHFACTIAQPTPEVEQPTDGSRLFRESVSYRSQIKGQGLCPQAQQDNANPRKERIDSIQVHEENGLVWDSLEFRLRQHFVLVQDAALPGDLMYVDVCPRVEQYLTPVYARTWLKSYVKDLATRVDDLARERAALVLWRRYELEPVVRSGKETLTLTSMPEKAGDAPERRKFNRVDFRVHSGPKGKEFVPCTDQDGHFGKANHFAFASNQSLQVLWSTKETSTGTLVREDIAARQAELLAGFDANDIISGSKKLVYVIEGYESLKRTSTQLDYAAAIGNINENTGQDDPNYSQERANAIMIIAAPDWVQLAVSGYGRTNVLRAFEAEMGYYFPPEDNTEILPKESEDANQSHNQLDDAAAAKGTDGGEIQPEPPEQVSEDTGTADYPPDNENAASEEVEPPPVWANVPKQLSELEKNQTAFLSVFLVDVDIAEQKGSPSTADIAYFLARSEASNRKTCLEPELIDQHAAQLERLTDYFKGKQFAPFKDITGLAPATILVCSNTAAAEGRAPLSSIHLASPLSRALASTGAVDLEETRVGFLHSIDRGDTTDFYMFGSSLLTHFTPNATLEHLRETCDRHPSIKISPDDNVKLDVCENDNLDAHKMVSGALYHIRSANTLDWLIADHADCKSNLENQQTETPEGEPVEIKSECLAPLMNPLVLFEELADKDWVFRIAIDVAFSLTDRMATQE